ncbi:hypothetical protein H8356DRAFT_1433292 [Neocallimastix lanati (nom. inval.)]|nr:hypothetical protein H8356DRAFT_1433292 [Neocallimastix sp. JGI-2020a]
MAIQLLINCKLRRSQSSLHTARRCIPNVPTYISNDHEHQNGIINSSLLGVIIGDWKFYNHQGLCFNSKRSIRVGLMNITCDKLSTNTRKVSEPTPRLSLEFIWVNFHPCIYGMSFILTLLRERYDKESNENLLHLRKRQET